MYFRDFSRSLLAAEAPLKLHAEKLEILAFNASVEQMTQKAAKTKASNVCNGCEFRRTYNWVVEAILMNSDFIVDNIRLAKKIKKGKKNSNIVPPSKLVNHLLHRLPLAATPFDDWRAALRLFAVRKLAKFDIDAARVESALAANYETTKQYGRQLQSILFNLKTTETGLLQRVQNNEISAEELATGTRQVFWPSKWAREDHQPGHLATIFTEDMSGAPSMLQCHNCKSFTVTYTEVQTRSADEPMVRTPLTPLAPCTTTHPPILRPRPSFAAAKPVESAGRCEICTAPYICTALSVKSVVIIVAVFAFVSW